MTRQTRVWAITPRLSRVVDPGVLDVPEIPVVPRRQRPPVDGSLDWEEILTFRPSTWTGQQKRSLKRREEELTQELWDEHVAGMRASVLGPEDDEEFSQMVLDPK